MPTNDARLSASIEARLDKLSAQLSRGNQMLGGFAAQTSKTLGQIQGRFDSLGKGAGASLQSAERQISGSTDRIRKSLLLVTTSLSGAFAANRVKDLADGYTRFTNQLKLASLEGQGLANTQNDLFGIAQKYGVELESIGTLYSRVAQAGDSLSASQSDLLKFTNGVGAALKIQGGAAAESKGALLQLAQLLGTGTVRAEEFNSVNEGARPILQAVASGIDKYRGSVAALRNDVIAGKVSSQDFFNGFLKGSADLEARATKANLTIGASFTVLNNALGKYVGETDASLSATQRLSAGIVALADNLGTLVPALAVIATAAGARAFGPLAQGAAAAALAAADLRVQNERGTATLLGSTNALRQKAALTAELATVEAAQAQARVAELTAERALIQENIRLTVELVAAENAARAQAKANAAAGFGGVIVGAGRASGAPNAASADNERARLQTGLVASGRSLTRVEAELAEATTLAAAASARGATASAAHAAAIGAAGLAARAGAASMALLEGAMAFFGGPIGLAIIAVTAAILANNAAEKHLQEEAAASAKAVSDLRAALDLAARYGGGAATQIKNVASQAAAGVAPVKEFAGAVGEAAAKLHELAVQRRNEALEALRAARAKAQAEVPALQAEVRSTRTFQASPSGPVGEPGARGAAGAFASRGFDATTDASRATTAAQQRLQGLQATIDKASAEIDRLTKTPLTGFVNESDRTGGRNISTEISDLQAQLKAAQAAHNGAAIREIQAQLYVRKQTTKYMKQGLSYEVALATAQKEASDIKSSGDAYAEGQEARKGARAAAAAAKAEEAARLKGVRDQKAFDADLRGAELDYLSAVAETSDSAQDRLAIELQRLAFARDQKNKEIAAEGPVETGGTGRFSAAKVKQLQDLNIQTANQEAFNKVMEDNRRAVAEELSVRLAGLDDQQELLQLQSGLTTTAKARRDAELRILDLQEEEERARLEAITVIRGATAEEEAKAKQRLSVLPDIYDLKRGGVRRDTESPAENFVRVNSDAEAAAERFQAITVGAFDNLADGLAQAAVNADNLGKVAKNVFRQMVADLLAAQLKKAIAPLLGLIPGFASGTASAPGGLAYVHRDELIDLPKNSRVISKANAMPALARMGSPVRSGGVTIVQPLNFDARGAVMTQDLLAQANGHANRAAQTAYARAVRDVNASMPDRNRRYDLLGS